MAQFPTALGGFNAGMAAGAERNANQAQIQSQMARDEMEQTKLMAEQVAKVQQDAVATVQTAVQAAMEQAAATGQPVNWESLTRLRQTLVEGVLPTVQQAQQAGIPTANANIFLQNIDNAYRQTSPGAKSTIAANKAYETALAQNSAAVAPNVTAGKAFAAGEVERAKIGVQTSPEATAAKAWQATAVARAKEGVKNEFLVGRGVSDIGKSVTDLKGLLDQGLIDRRTFDSHLAGLLTKGASEREQKIAELLNRTDASGAPMFSRAEAEDIVSGRVRATNPDQQGNVFLLNSTDGSVMRTIRIPQPGLPRQEPLGLAGTGAPEPLGAAGAMPTPTPVGSGDAPVIGSPQGGPVPTGQPAESEYNAKLTGGMDVYEAAAKGAGPWGAVKQGLSNAFGFMIPGGRIAPEAVDARDTLRKAETTIVGLFAGDSSKASNYEQQKVRDMLGDPLKTMRDPDDVIAAFDNLKLFAYTRAAVAKRQLLDPNLPRKSRDEILSSLNRMTGLAYLLEEGMAGGGQSQYKEGKIYVDGNGNLAKYVGGQWVEQ